MKKKLRSLTILVTALLFTAPLLRAQTSTGTTTLSVTVAAEAALTINTGTTNLTSTGTNFSTYTGTTNLTYFLRTKQSTGTGSIVLQVTGDFSPAGGPSVGTPPTAGDKLNYSCSVNSPGNNGAATNCANPTTAATSGQTSVATFGADNRSAIGGNTGTVTWSLTNDPKYQTGSYSATVTFTISAN